MQTITDINLLVQMKSSGALFILFGGEHCAACQSLRLQLDSILKQQFAEMQIVYIDWSIPEINLVSLG